METNTLIKMGVKKKKTHAEKEKASVKRILRGLKWVNEALGQPGYIYIYANINIWDVLLKARSCW